MILGKTNLSEWANFRSTHSTSGWSGRGGQTRNPYALDRNPCGSSSGSGAAIAANLAAVGDRHRDRRLDRLARRPTAALVGIKPTLGLRQPHRHHPDRAQPGHGRARWPAPSPTPPSCSARWPASIRARPDTATSADARAAPTTRSSLERGRPARRAHRRGAQASSASATPVDRLMEEAIAAHEAPGRGASSIRRTSRRSASSTTPSSRCCSTSSRRT